MLTSDETAAIECVALSRRYAAGGRDERKALDGLDLAVRRGTVFGILGPNGAGKTTTVRILSTLLAPSSGKALVHGFDVRTQQREVRRRIGVVFGGEKGLFGRLTARQNLTYFAILNGLDRGTRRSRVDDLLGRVGLAERADDVVDQYSRGMKQRLHIARGLIGDPEVLFLDEPTMGLDPESAGAIRAMIPQLVARGTSVILTTHDMYEADLLCERLAIIVGGRKLVEGGPHEIRTEAGGIYAVEATLALSTGFDDRAFLGSFGSYLTTRSAEGSLTRLRFTVPLGMPLLGHIHEAFGDLVVNAHERPATLEEAYLSIVRA